MLPVRAITQWLWRILRAPYHRWRNETDVMYVLDMPIRPCSQTWVALTVIKKMEWDGDLDRFAQQREVEDAQWRKHSYVGEMQKRLSKGDWCYLAMQQNQPIGIIYASRGPCFIAPVHYTLRLPEHAVGLYDVYSIQAVRGCGFYSSLFHAVMNDCAAEGFGRAWMWIMPHNVVSFRVHNKLGMNHVFKKIMLRQQWGLRWHISQDFDMSVQALLDDLLTPGYSDESSSR